MCVVSVGEFWNCPTSSSQSSERTFTCAACRPCLASRPSAVTDTTADMTAATAMSTNAFFTVYLLLAGTRADAVSGCPAYDPDCSQPDGEPDRVPADPDVLDTALLGVDSRDGAAQ